MSAPCSISFSIDEYELQLELWFCLQFCIYFIELVLGPTDEGALWKARTRGRTQLGSSRWTRVYHWMKNERVYHWMRTKEYTIEWRSETSWRRFNIFSMIFSFKIKQIRSTFMILFKTLSLLLNKLLCATSGSFFFNNLIF